MIAVTKHADGWILPVRARPGAKSNELLDESDGALELSVTAPPEDNKANEAIVRLLAESLSLSKNQIALLAGASTLEKRFLIRGLQVEELLARIDAALQPTVYDPLDPNKEKPEDIEDTDT